MPDPCRNQPVSSLEFGALPSAVPCARLHARAVMHEWDLGPAAEAAELVVSELVTNAVQASVWATGRGPLSGHDSPIVAKLCYRRRPGLPAVALRLSRLRESVRIEVWDEAPAPPQLHAPGPGDDHGRGLLLVASLSARWGYYLSDGGGKVVWAEVAAVL